MKFFRLHVFASRRLFGIENENGLVLRHGYKNASVSATACASTQLKSSLYLNSRHFIQKTNSQNRQKFSDFQRPTVAVHSPQATAVEYNRDAGTIEIVWDQKDSDSFPILWLRDNCQCPQCFNESAMSRRLLMRDLDPDTTPSQIKVHVLWYCHNNI